MNPVWKQKLDVIERLRKQHGESVVLAEFPYPEPGDVRENAYFPHWRWRPSYSPSRVVPNGEQLVVVGGQLTSLTKDYDPCWITLHLLVGDWSRWGDLHREPCLEVVPSRQNYDVTIWSSSKPPVADLGPGLVLLYGWRLPEELRPDGRRKPPY